MASFKLERKDTLLLLIESENRMCMQLFTLFNEFLDLAIKKTVLPRYKKNQLESISY